MNSETIQLLESYDSNIIELNLQNKNITGILDLINFTNLEKLDCSENNITQIINYPVSLIILVCGDNKITELDNLPENLDTLLCHNNNIKFLDNLPTKLKKLVCLGNKITTLDYLPSKLRYLYCSDLLNINLIPNSIKTLICRHFTVNLDILSKNLITLRVAGCNLVGTVDLSKFKKLYEFNCDFNEVTSIINIPNSLKVLLCSKNKITTLDNLPNNLVKLLCYRNLITSLDNLPVSLEILDCSINPISNLDLLNNINLKELICNKTNRIVINNIPPSLKKLSCCNNLVNLHDIKKKFPNVIIKNYDEPNDEFDY